MIARLNVGEDGVGEVIELIIGDDSTCAETSTVIIWVVYVQLYRQLTRWRIGRSSHRNNRSACMTRLPSTIITQCEQRNKRP